MKIIELNPYAPAGKHLKDIVAIFDKGGLVVYPTDAGYSIGCLSSHGAAIKKLYALKKPLKKYVMALMFANFSKITEFAKVGNIAFRFMKNRVPGPYTFILPSQIHIQRKLGIKRPEIGVRMPDTILLEELLKELSAPILNTAAKIEQNQGVLSPGEIIKTFKSKCDLFIDVGEVYENPTNIISLIENEPEVIRGEI
jgi:tRNA threonylcarbamoyl adenosine modification protein (Sua5/YciO/YrdC/YwlC family)